MSDLNRSLDSTYWRSRGLQPWLLLEIARGNVQGIRSITKFGRATNVDTGIITDVWDGANATTDQDIWLAPTAPRIHAMVSTDGGDDVDSGVGARTIRIRGLPDWDTPEISEDISLQGTAPVNTVNPYVIIHQMSVLTKGGTASNIGFITATAASDGTITAQINPGVGQTGMAIYGIPSTDAAYIGRFYGNVNKSGGASGAVDVQLMVNPEPADEPTNFVTKHTFGLITTGTSALTINYATLKLVEGPAIIKVQAIGSANNLDVSAGYDLIVMDERT